MKCYCCVEWLCYLLSPFARRVWIEITPPVIVTAAPAASPFARRVWIEMRLGEIRMTQADLSPFARRVWIEIFLICRARWFLMVTLREKGVD